MAKPLTVQQLCRSCLNLIKGGHGDKKVFIYNDEEGNGVHGARYTLDTRKEEIEYFKEDIERDGCKVDEVVLLG